MRARLADRGAAPRLGAALALLATFAAPGIAAETHRWTGADDAPLPFATDEEILGFLAQAPIVESKVLTSGTTRPLKLTLERDGVKAHAVFRTVDIDRRLPGHKGPAANASLRDRYVYEVAAYQLARLLGLGSVPPATLREVDGERGSIQLWVEHATPEAERLAARRVPADPAGLARQKSGTMEPFDALIHNFDRNHGNMLVDETGRLWLIDHTRSFRAVLELPEPDKPTVIERRLFEAIRGLDLDALTARLRPYLSPPEIDAVWRRRKTLLDGFERRIAAEGEGPVLLGPNGR